MKINVPCGLLACLLLFAFILSGCSADNTINSEVRKAENDFATNYVHKLFCGDTAYCLSNVTAAIDDTAGSKIVAACHFLKPLQYESSKLVSATPGKEHSMFLRYEYTMKGGYLYFELNVVRVNNGFVANGFNTYSSGKPLSQIHFFIADHKINARYAFLFFGILIWLFQIITIIVIAKGPLSRLKKTSWILLSAFSVGRIIMNWTTGVIHAHAWAVNFTAFYALHLQKNDIWLLNIHVPVWTIVFWLRRKKIMRDDKIKTAADEQIADSYRKREHLGIGD